MREAGFEPAKALNYQALNLTPLATWELSQNTILKKVRGAGFEPTKALSYWVLSPAPLTQTPKKVACLAAWEPSHSHTFNYMHIKNIIYTIHVNKKLF